MAFLQVLRLQQRISLDALPFGGIRFNQRRMPKTRLSFNSSKTQVAASDASEAHPVTGSYSLPGGPNGVSNLDIRVFVRKKRVENAALDIESKELEVEKKPIEKTMSGLPDIEEFAYKSANGFTQLSKYIFLAMLSFYNCCV
uniref:Endonuclease III homolog 1ic-like n=1 Tax=Rhizophora mucronata TaxID=61149 RepID=A0A2P2LAB0_RHIMU